MGRRSATDGDDPADDAEARFSRGLDLLAGADSLESLERGVALVEDAARRSHAGAVSMLATLDSVGAGRPRNWSRALDHLETAARLGSEPARGQLRLLATRALSGIEAARDWGRLRQDIDVDRLLEAPRPVALSETPRLRVFEAFASRAECEWLISRLKPKLAPAMTWDVVTGEGRLDPGRSNSAVELRLAEMDVVLALVRARISAATRLPEFIFEVPQLMHYAPGQEFKPHHDFLDPQSSGHAADLARRGQRMGTFLIFLNEDFEGGETDFPAAGLSYRGRTGDALFFANVTPDGRPDPLTLHAGRPPTTGEKWIVSQWIRDRPPTQPLP